MTNHEIANGLDEPIHSLARIGGLMSLLDRWRDILTGKLSTAEQEEIEAMLEAVRRENTTARDQLNEIRIVME